MPTPERGDLVSCSASPSTRRSRSRRRSARRRSGRGRALPPLPVEPLAGRLGGVAVHQGRDLLPAGRGPHAARRRLHRRGDAAQRVGGRGHRRRHRPRAGRRGARRQPPRRLAGARPARGLAPGEHEDAEQPDAGRERPRRAGRAGPRPARHRLRGRDRRGRPACPLRQRRPPDAPAPRVGGRAAGAHPRHDARRGAVRRLGAPRGDPAERLGVCCCSATGSSRRAWRPARASGSDWRDSAPPSTTSGGATPSRPPTSRPWSTACRRAGTACSATT